LRDEIDRFFGPSLFPLARPTGFLNGWAPAVDVYEDGDNVIVKAELPGVKREEIDVSLHNGVVTITGERKADDQHEGAEVCRSERFVGRFQRAIALPTPVQAGKVKASYQDGILNIVLPKTEEAKPKRIEVNVK
jgi:HSP20 family protein